MTVDLFVRDRDFPQYNKQQAIKLFKKVRRTGRLYQIQGSAVELFPIGVLAEAIDRSNTFITKWEKEKKIPPAPFIVERNKGVHNVQRGYPASLVVNANRLFVCNYRGRTKFKGRELFDKFIDELNRLFYLQDYSVNPIGYVDVPVDNYADIFTSKEEFTKKRWHERVHMDSSGAKTGASRKGALP